MWPSITALSPLDLSPGCTLRRTARLALLGHRISVERRMAYQLGPRQALSPVRITPKSMDQVDYAEMVRIGAVRPHFG